MKSKQKQFRFALLSAILWSGGFVGSSFGVDDIIGKLDALNAEIARSREVTARSETTLEELRRDLFEGAVKAREAKRLSDGVDPGRLDPDALTGELEKLRGDIVQIGVLLRTYRDRLDAMTEIVQRNQKTIEQQQASIESLRRAGKDRAPPAKTVETPVKTESAPVIKISGNPLEQGEDALAAGRIDEAMVAFKAAIAMNPASEDARLGLASCHFELGELDTARRLVEDVLAQNDENARALGLRGALMFREGNVRGARRALEKAIKIDEENAYNYNYLAVVLNHQNRNRQAIKLLEKAIELDPGYVGALYNLAVLLATDREPDIGAAQRYYSRALQLGAPANAALEAMIGVP